MAFLCSQLFKKETQVIGYRYITADHVIGIHIYVYKYLCLEDFRVNLNVIET